MTTSPTRSSAGSQTLARGITALKLIASSKNGLSAQELADHLGVHRTIAYRIAGTLSSASLVSRGTDGRYRGATGLLELRAAAFESVKDAAAPLLAKLANDLGATASLLITEQSEAIALLVLSPSQARYHIAFREGSSHPLNHGSAGLALRSTEAPTASDSDALLQVRIDGFAVTHGEVEPGAWGLAVPVRIPGSDQAACVNVIALREEIARSSVEQVKACARAIESTLATQE